MNTLNVKMDTKIFFKKLLPEGLDIFCLLTSLLGKGNHTATHALTALAFCTTPHRPVSFPWEIRKSTCRYSHRIRGGASAFKIKDSYQQNIGSNFDCLRERSADYINKFIYFFLQQ